MGHRLTIAMNHWQASVDWVGDEPVSAEFAVEVESFEVLRGEGGIKGLSGPEKAVVKSNAMKSLDAGRHPEIRFAAETIDKTDAGYRLTGNLHIRGRSREHEIDLRIEDLGEAWRMSAESCIRQTDYGIKPYSLLMGSVRVADDVSVSFSAVHAKDD
jgi:polyisoprenoid-binding protein YceI